MTKNHVEKMTGVKSETMTRHLARFREEQQAQELAIILDDAFGKNVCREDVILLVTSYSLKNRLSSREGDLNLEMLVARARQILKSGCRDNSLTRQGDGR